MKLFYFLNENTFFPCVLRFNEIRWVQNQSFSNLHVNCKNSYLKMRKILPDYLYYVTWDKNNNFLRILLAVLLSQQYD